MRIMFLSKGKLMQRKIAFLCLLLCLSISLAFANSIDATRTFILSEDTNLDDPIKLRQAFAQILAMNTGENIFDILQNPLFLETNPKSAVKRAYFEKIERKYLSGDVSKYWFHVVMDEDFILQMVQKAGFSLLPHERQEIMLWAVKEEWIEHDEEFSLSREKGLDYAYNDEKFTYWFNKWSQSLGLIFTNPVLDEGDMFEVSQESIKTLTYDASQQSLERYHTEQSSLIYFERDEGTVKVRSGYFDKTGNMTLKHFQEISENEDIVWFSVMADIFDKYASLRRIKSSSLQNHSVQIEVHSIQGYDQVREVEKYLQKLSVVRQMDIIAASKGSLILKVDLIVSSDTFLEILENDNFLERNQNNPINRLVFDVINQEL